jgi:putrescine transport system permease protein
MTATRERRYRKPRRALSPGAALIVVMPYLWLVAFFLAPFLIVLKISFSQTAIARRRHRRR